MLIALILWMFSGTRHRLPAVGSRTQFVSISPIQTANYGEPNDVFRNRRRKGRMPSGPKQKETFDETLGSDGRSGGSARDGGPSVVCAGRRTCATAAHSGTIAASAKRDGSVSPRDRCSRRARRDHAGRSAA